MSFLGLFGPPDVDKLYEKKNVKGLIRAFRRGKIPRGARIKAVEYLGFLGDERAVEPLIKAIHEPIQRTDDVSKAVEHALARLAKQTTIDEGLRATIWIKLLWSPNIDISREAASKLGTLGDKSAVEPLIRVIKGSGERFVRQEAVSSLAKLGGVRAVAGLTTALSDDSDVVRKTAEKALKDLNARSLVDDPSNPGYWIAKGDWDRVEKMGAFAVDALISTVENLNASNEKRRNAARTLQKISKNVKLQASVCQRITSAVRLPIPESYISFSHKQHGDAVCFGEHQDTSR